jgi:hypothetical protein
MTGRSDPGQPRDRRAGFVPARTAAIRAASLSAAIMEAGFATPCPAMS